MTFFFIFSIFDIESAIATLVTPITSTTLPTLDQGRQMQTRNTVGPMKNTGNDKSQIKLWQYRVHSRDKFHPFKICVVVSLRLFGTQRELRFWHVFDKGTQIPAPTDML